MIKGVNEKVVFNMKKMMKFQGDKENYYSYFRVDILNYLDEECKNNKLVTVYLEWFITQSSTIEDQDLYIREVTKALES